MDEIEKEKQRIKAIETSRKWAKLHPERMRINYRKWRNNNLEKAKALSRKSNTKKQKETRNKILELLGSKCNNPECPIPRNKMDIRALQVDHINDNGYKERKQLKQYQMYKRVLKYPEDYQLLCAYCNWLKKYKNKLMEKK
jgi:hypothetical protein